MIEARNRCPFCDELWDWLRIVFDKTTRIHVCRERDGMYVGWFVDKDSIPFIVPDEYMEW